MVAFYQSVPYEAKSPHFVVRLASNWISAPFFRKVHRNAMIGTLGRITAQLILLCEKTRDADQASFLFGAICLLEERFEHNRG